MFSELSTFLLASFVSMVVAVSLTILTSFIKRWITYSRVVKKLSASMRDDISVEDIHNLIDEINYLRKHPKIVIIHSIDDANFANSLENDLSRAGVEVLASNDEPRTDSKISYEFKKSIPSSQWALYIIPGPDSKDNTISKKLDLALSSESRRRRPYIFYLKLKKSKLPNRYNENKLIDFSGDYKEGLTELLARIIISENNQLKTHEQSSGSDDFQDTIEIAECIIGGSFFGIYANLIRQMIPLDHITIDEAAIEDPSVIGLFTDHGQSIPIIDLRPHLNLPGDLPSNGVVVVVEVIGLSVGIVIDKVGYLSRVTFDKFTSNSIHPTLMDYKIVGTTIIDGQKTYILDIEQIVGEIFPASMGNYDESYFLKHSGDERRKDSTVFFVEDSQIIRNSVSKLLGSLGYSKLQSFENADECLAAIRILKKESESKGKKLQDLLQLVLTDISMPKMSGIELCHKIKNNIDPMLPVIIFSNTQTKELTEKYQEVGADGWVLKQNSRQLVNLIDQFSGIEKNKEGLFHKN